MRNESITPNERPNIPTLAWYHGSKFENLGFFNSDRFIKVNSDYTVSNDNSPSTLKIMKPGTVIGGYGIEWEMVNSQVSNHTILANLLTVVFSKLFPNDLFRMEEDCTVDVESVSQVMSKSFIRNNYKNFKTCYDEYFPAFGFSTDSTQCGMHVNISLALLGKDSDTQIDNARKLGYLINKHYDFFMVAFARKLGANTWCPRMNSTKEYWKETRLTSFPTNHRTCCVNMDHVNVGRLEIRLVGGQKNYACFRNTMETVFQVVETVSKLKWDDMDDLTKIFKGCNQYTFDRLTKCRTEGVLPQADLDKIENTVKRVNW